MPFILLLVLAAWLGIGAQSVSDSALRGAFHQAAVVVLGAAITPIAVPIGIGMALSWPQLPKVGT